MTFVGAETSIIDAWIEARLGGLVPTTFKGVYQNLAPREAQYPFAVYQMQSSTDVRGVGGTRMLIDTLYTVKAIAQTNDFSVLRPQAAAIDAAMTLLNGADVLNGFIITSSRQEPFALATYEEGKDFRHLGGIFQILAQAS